MTGSPGKIRLSLTARAIPQGLKPASVVRLNGTTEVVPFHAKSGLDGANEVVSFHTKSGLDGTTEVASFHEVRFGRHG